VIRLHQIGCLSSVLYKVEKNALRGQHVSLCTLVCNLGIRPKVFGILFLDFYVRSSYKLSEKKNNFRRHWSRTKFILYKNINELFVSVTNRRFINIWMPQPIFMKLGMYIMAPDPISTAYYINPTHQSVYFPLSLLGKGSVKTSPWQRIHTQQ
jgi:hypothetical protein